MKKKGGVIASWTVLITKKIKKFMNIKKITCFLLLTLATTLSTFAANGHSKSVRNSTKKYTAGPCASGKVTDENGNWIGNWYSCLPGHFIIVYC